MLDLLTSPEAYLSLLTLTSMEIVLGIDNIIFISILTAKLPVDQRERARKLGLLGALVTRLGLLLIISWLASLTAPLFSVLGRDFSGKALILLAGGLFLLFKATREIHDKLEGDAIHGSDDGVTARKAATFGAVIAQIMLLDLVFSVDSVITAIGMTPHVSIMVVANLVALAVMLLSVNGISNFVERHPSVKMLALSFLMMIGSMLVAEGVGFHIPKGYIYFAMAFSVVVEILNIRTSGRKAKPVVLHNVPRI